MVSSGLSLEGVQASVTHLSRRQSANAGLEVCRDTLCCQYGNRSWHMRNSLVIDGPPISFVSSSQPRRTFRRVHPKLKSHRTKRGFNTCQPRSKSPLTANPLYGVSPASLERNGPLQLDSSLRRRQLQNRSDKSAQDPPLLLRGPSYGGLRQSMETQKRPQPFVSFPLVGGLDGWFGGLDWRFLYKTQGPKSQKTRCASFLLDAQSVT